MSTALVNSPRPDRALALGGNDAARLTLEVGDGGGSPLARGAVAAAIVALALFAFVTFDLPRELVWLAVIQLVASNRRLRTTGHTVALLVAPRRRRYCCVRR
jgi:hypothetical protein